MKYKENQFVALPTIESSKPSELIPEEEYVYLGLKSFYNSETKQCNPSYQKLSERLKIKSVKTIKKYIDNLEEKGYIKVIRGKYKQSNQYEFIKELSGFTKFSYEFFDNDKLNANQKAFLASMQRLMYLNEESGIGNTTLQELDIAQRINQSGSLVNKRLKELLNMGIVKVSDTSTRDNQTGLIKKLYSFDLSQYNPIIKVLVNHEVRLDSVEERLARLERENWELQNKLNQNNN